jgi:mRNA interferase MazF
VGGVYASKPRPALIIQDDRFHVTASVTVCPLSTVLRDAPLIRVPVELTEANGLAQPSEIMVDRITTVRRANVGGRVGGLTKQEHDSCRAVPPGVPRHRRLAESSLRLVPRAPLLMTGRR